MKKPDKKLEEYLKKFDQIIGYYKHIEQIEKRSALKLCRQYNIPKSQFPMFFGKKKDSIGLRPPE